MSFCAFCYAPDRRLLRCGQCQKRQFCSRECQRQDWKTQHKQFCKKAGEIGYDFEIKSCEKGMGVFALRPFKKNDMIMAERPILKFPSGTQPKEAGVPNTAKNAIDALHPQGASFHKKVLTNGISCTPDAAEDYGETGLFVTMSRVNHHCLGNSDHQYLHHRDARILVASCDINEGEEVTFAYIGNKTRDARRSQLMMTYAFICSCSVCTDPGLEAKLSESRELDDAIPRMGGDGRIELAIRKGRRLTAIYDEIGASSWLYHRTYYDLFQVAITKSRYVTDGKEYIRQAYEAVLAYTQDENDPSVGQMKGFMQSPESHRNYLIL
jgi:hypothetical protein